MHTIGGTVSAFIGLTMACAMGVSAANASLAVSSGSAAAGGSVSLNLTFTKGTDQAPSALQWTLNYPTASVSKVTIATGSGATAAGKSVQCSGNTCLVSGTNNTALSSGVVAVATFKLSSSASGNLAVQLSNTVSASPSATSLTLTTANGVISVGSTFTLTLGVSPSGSGTVTANPSGGTYASGTQVCLTATPSSGWAFSSWSGATLNGSNCLTITANTTVTANFVRTYTLTLGVSPSGSGTVTANPSGGTYASGTQVCLTATPKAGWAFSSWSGATLNGSNCLTITANTTVTAT